MQLRFGDIVTLRGVDYMMAMEEEEKVGRAEGFKTYGTSVMTNRVPLRRCGRRCCTLSSMRRDVNRGLINE